MMPVRCLPAALCLVAFAGRASAQQWSAAFANNGPTDTVNTLCVASPSAGAPARLYAGGAFTTVSTPGGSIAADYIASWDGHAWVPGPGLTGEVASLVVHPYNGTPTLFAGKTMGITSGGPLARLTNGQWTEMLVDGQAYVYGVA
jgi:hypothetical protein